MKCISLCPPNAILFLFDPTNRDAEVPQYVDGQLTAATASCISVGTQAEVDGETTVCIDPSGKDCEHLSAAFVGTIETPNRKFAIVTATFQRLLEVNVLNEICNVEIWVDDLRSPSEILVVTV
jgi:hypothetical protein